MYIKSHESPRNMGRNSKGKKGSAAIKQQKARTKALQRKIKSMG